jgi:hypothetical protein
MLGSFGGGGDTYFHSTNSYYGEEVEEATSLLRRDKVSPCLLDACLKRQMRRFGREVPLVDVCNKRNLYEAVKELF